METSDKISMEIDSSEHTVITVTGQVIHFNKGAAFFRFTKQNKDEVCLFRPNKLFIDGQKLGASHFKSVEAISQILSVGDPISGLAGPITEPKPYKLEALGTEITPGWYAQIVWKGERPGEVDNIAKTSEDKAEKEVIIDDVPGKIVHNKMAINGKGGANQTFIAFTNPDGKEDLAMFRNPRYFYIDGERARADLIRHWPVGQEMDVMFTGIYTPSLKEYVHIEGETGETMSVETRFKPNWRARIVWIGQKPTEETMTRDNADRITVVKNKKDKTEFLETIKDCDYLCARLEKIVSNCQVMNLFENAYKFENNVFNIF